MQLTLPPTARGFLVPWELNSYSLAVLQQHVSQFLLGKQSTFCGIQCVQRPPCTEVYIYATAWKDEWKKEMQELCYRATATGAGVGGGCGGMGMGMGGMAMGGMGGMAMGMPGMPGMGMGMMGGVPVPAAKKGDKKANDKKSGGVPASTIQAHAYAHSLGMCGMACGGCGGGGMGIHGGIGGIGGIGGMPRGMGMFGLGFGIGPASPPMMHGAPIEWGHRPLPVLMDRPAAPERPLPDLNGGERPLPKLNKKVSFQA